MKILIIDDSLMDRKLLISLIKKSGIENEILQAADGEEGLKVLSENYQNICIILLDWQMPKLNGLDFMKAVVKVPATAATPIVMVTASGSEDSKKQAMDVNPNLAGYIVKPYKAETLLEIIKKYIK